MLRAPVKLPNLVPHPRYGATIIPSGLKVAPAVIRKFWGYRRETIFPETAILADLSRQDYSVLPRRYYVDILKECRDCKRRFIFFALEQKYWYEELQFNIDANCVRCPDCRKDERLVRAAAQRHSRNANRRDMTDDELAKHVDDLCLLLDLGIIKNRQKVSWVVSAARKRLGDPKRLARLERSWLAAVDSKK
jgi:hypothetical protein